MTMTVSIIVPIYNQEMYLHKSIPSLLSQSYRNLDIVLIDDGSTDSSYEICLDYAQSDDRIRLFQQKNQGLVGATITGIKQALGDYIVFVDPDDYVTEQFVAQFISANDQGFDMLAMGFFIEESIGIASYELRQAKDYFKDEIALLRRDFLMRNGKIANDIFVSRWNKMFKTSAVKKILKHLESCKSITLGEDTLFNYLFLTIAESVRAIPTPNGYIYNRRNLSSMTAEKDSQKWLEKATKVYTNFQELLSTTDRDSILPNELYFILVENLFNRLKESDQELFSKFYRTLKQDVLYKESYQKVFPKLSKKQKIQYVIKKLSSGGYQYLFWMDLLKKLSFSLRLVRHDVKQLVSKFNLANPVQSYYQFLFSRRRLTAYRDLERDLPLLEQRITPILSPYLNKVTDLAAAPVVNNIFVMWWDGFDNAPALVRDCLESVERYFGDCTLIKIDKWNYQQFTDIHPTLLEDFDKGKISIQTFSDILRFNLLKNNGGTWLDATIFFADNYPLTEKLQQQSFDSIEFLTSKEFLTYKGEQCSWSGFCISSRKGGVLVTAMDEIFREYYLKYGNFQNYFFIDSALMICKLLKIDGDVLSNITFKSGSMFSLISLIDRPYHYLYDEQVKLLPQKLIWSKQTTQLDDETCYSFYIKNGGRIK